MYPHSGASLLFLSNTVFQSQLPCSAIYTFILYIGHKISFSYFIVNLRIGFFARFPAKPELWWQIVTPRPLQPKNQPGTDTYHGKLQPE